MKTHEKSPSAVFKNGGVVVFPTDTVYGIGCKFDSGASINRIYKIKGTPKIQHFPILVSNITQVEKIADINKAARKLMEKHWPGGLTIVLKTKYRKEKVGFRMPDFDSLRKIIDDVGPIIGTSANFHGQNSPTSFEELDSKLISMVDYIVKGECKKGIESTVIDTTADPPKILRQGAVHLT